MGLLQPFRDGAKLFLKEQIKLSDGNRVLYYFSPVLRIILAMGLWVVYPYGDSVFSIEYGVLLFLCLSRFRVFPIIIAG
ncbi:NADH-quinone oxidoreductase subunit H [Escherichia coli]|nr:NADH-quinone oxidoreductase subunit H [Escherichia coli]